MSVRVNFRVVGVFLYFPDLLLHDVNEDSTVQEILEAIKKVHPEFNYKQGGGYVHEISYLYSDRSTEPLNTSAPPSDGLRSLQSHTDKGAPVVLVWQYYRSVKGTINGTEVDIVLNRNKDRKGQESFTERKLNASDSRLPEGFNVISYNLTWRLIQIDMSPENQAKFEYAKRFQ